jgi:restriction system protein
VLSVADYGPEDSYHYPTELLALLQDCIPLLCRGKSDVFQFFRAAGVSRDLYSDWETRWRNDSDSVGKYPVVRDVLNKLNARQTNDALRQRREIIKRVTAWENFTTLWEKDRMPAKGLVAEIRQTVKMADAFTKMEREKDEARREQSKAKQAELDAARTRRSQRDAIRKEIGALFSESNHQKRGKALEGLLNRLFTSFDISIRDAFNIRGEEGEGIIAQIDGAIALDNDIYLVEMKWLSEKVGPGDIAQHVTRVMHRGEGARGLFISATDYTPAAQKTLCEALNYRVHIATGLYEIIFALEKEADIRQLLRDKVQAAILDKNPMHFVAFS